MPVDDAGRFARLDFSEDGAASPAPNKIDWANTTAEACVATADDHFAHGRWERALEAYSRALRFDRVERRAWIGQVRCQIEMTEYAKAATWAMRGLEHVGNDPELVAARGLAAILLGDREQGVHLLDSVPRPSSSAWVLLYQARALQRIDSVSGQRLLAQAREMAGDDGVVNLQVGRTCNDYRLFGEALPVLAKASRFFPQNAYVLYEQGRASEGLGDDVSARSSYEKAVTLEPLFYPARDGMERVRRWRPLALLTRRIASWKK